MKNAFAFYIFYAILYVNMATQEASKFKVWLLYCIVVALGFFTARIFFPFLNMPIAAKQRNIQIVKALPPEIQTYQDNLGVFENIDALAPDKLAKITVDTENQLTEEDSAEPKFMLNGLFFSKDKKYAIINDKIVKEGDKVDDAWVTKITSGGVELRFQAENIKLTYTP